MMQRAFTATLSCAAVTWPPWDATGQNRGRSSRRGILVQAPRSAAHWVAFFDQMRKNGYVENVNLWVIDGFYTSADRAEQIAKAIVAQRPDVILTAGVFTRVVQRETQAIPILTVSVRHVIDAADIEPAMDAMVGAGAQALNVLASSLLNRNCAQIIVHAAALRLPAIYQWPEVAEKGGLMAYGPRFVTLYRQHARQVQKVLEGASPSDIPVEQPTTFEPIIHLRTAKGLGLRVPPALLSRTDEVIE
jgi:ABC-type uncharacterized transport system substrate-binding protein